MENMENIKKLKLSSLIIVAIFLIFAIPALEISEGKKDNDIHQKYIGSQVIINKDTLTVVNWNSGSIGIKRGFTLSNGVIVNDKMIIKNNN